MKKWLLVALILIIIGMIVGLYMYNKGPRQLKNEKTELSISATELFNSFSENETEANSKFLDKVVEVSGEIKAITSDGTKGIVLETGDMLSSVICEMDDEVSLEGLRVGNQVIIKGQCTGYLMDVILVKSIIVKK